LRLFSTIPKNGSSNIMRNLIVYFSIILSILTFSEGRAWANASYRVNGIWHIYEDNRIRAELDYNRGGAMVKLTNKRTNTQYLTGDGYHYLGSPFGGDGDGNTFDQSWERRPTIRALVNTPQKIVLQITGNLRMTIPGQPNANKDSGLAYTRVMSFEANTARIDVDHTITVSHAGMNSANMTSHRVMMLSVPIDADANVGMVNWAWKSPVWWFGCCNSWNRRTGTGVSSGVIPERIPGHPNDGLMVCPGAQGSDLVDDWFTLYGAKGGIGRLFKNRSQIATFNYWRNVPQIDWVRTIEFFFVNRDRSPVDSSYTPPTLPDGHTFQASESLYIHDGDWTTFVQMLPAAPTPKNDASIVSHTIPKQMTPGSSHKVSITIQNTGTTTWSEAQNYRLGTVGDTDPFTTSDYWNGNRIRLPASTTVAPKQSVQFSFQMLAPAQPGTYLTDWRMVQDGKEWFGDTLKFNVQVGHFEPTQPEPITPEPPPTQPEPITPEPPPTQPEPITPEPPPTQPEPITSEPPPTQPELSSSEWPQKTPDAATPTDHHTPDMPDQTFDDHRTTSPQPGCFCNQTALSHENIPLFALFALILLCLSLFSPVVKRLGK
jgi:hypothetical protein